MMKLSDIERRIRKLCPTEKLSTKVHFMDGRTETMTFWKAFGVVTSAPDTVEKVTGKDHGLLNAMLTSIEGFEGP